MFFLFVVVVVVLLTVSQKSATDNEELEKRQRMFTEGDKALSWKGGNYHF